MTRLITALALLIGLAPPVMAQDGVLDLPQWQSTTVNDLAGLLTPDDSAALQRLLDTLRDDTGVEGTVVTLNDRASHGGADGLEPFATRLFNHWGVGDAQRRDGFMVLVLAQDREARIELGAGYEHDADILAQDIMRNTMLPAFQAGDLSRGTLAGTQAVVDLIARPVAQGQPPQSGKSWTNRIVGFLFFGAWAGILGMIARRAWRRAHCPQCNKRGLQTIRTPQKIPLPEGGFLASNDDVTRQCPHCGFARTTTRARPQRIWYGAAGEILRQDRNPAYRGAGGRGGSGFGGGSSRGGGASGRW